MTEKEDKTIKSNKKKINWKTIGAVSLVIIMLLSAWFYQQYKNDELRRQEFQAQRQELVDFWKSKGLTDQEIQEKLKNDRPNNFPEGESSMVRDVMRTVRHATGTGPGVRPQ